jgi:hypothetical protein
MSTKPPTLGGDPPSDTVALFKISLPNTRDRNDRKGVSFRTKMRMKSEFEEKSFQNHAIYNSPH